MTWWKHLAIAVSCRYFNFLTLQSLCMFASRIHFYCTAGIWRGYFQDRRVQWKGLLKLLENSHEHYHINGNIKMGGQRRGSNILSRPVGWLQGPFYGYWVAVHYLAPEHAKASCWLSVESWSLWELKNMKHRVAKQVTIIVRNVVISTSSYLQLVVNS